MLGRFDIQAEADLHAAVVNVQFNKRLTASFGGSGSGNDRNCCF